MKTYTSLNLIQEDLKKGNISCISLVEYYLANITSKAHLNALVEVYEEEARNKALQIDQKIKNGTAGKLAGLIVSIKDVLSYTDHHLNGGSKILDGFVAQYTGTAVEKLLKEDAIIIGRNNCDEFAMGSSNENSAFGNVLNEADTERVPGGSSGGSAVAVQADLCLMSLGSDTGGSVRQPAAFCGIIGLKPTYSRISRHGLIAYASSFDSIGIFGKNVEDISNVLEVISGADEYDSTVSHREIPNYIMSLKKKGEKYKIAYIEETINSNGLQPEITNNFNQQLDVLKESGHIINQVSFPLIEYILPTYYILTTAEASSNLSRYDGVKYGFRSPNSSNMESMYKKSR